MQPTITTYHAKPVHFQVIVNSMSDFKKDQMVYLSLAEENFSKLKTLLEANGIPFEQKIVQSEKENESLPELVSAKLEYYELSNRETEVMKELMSGLEYQEIADKLFISLETVRSHVKNIFRKLGVSSRAEANARILNIQPRLVG